MLCDSIPKSLSLYYIKKTLKQKEIAWTSWTTILLNGIKVQVFFGKNIEKKHLCHHDKSYYYFWKSNIHVINMIVDSRNMIKLSKNMSL